ncbi:MAG: divergent PAP2 family protein [Nanoarchaeota archaeon]
MIADILLSRIVISVVVAAVLSQILKFITHRITSGDWDWRMTFTDGGMPSAHTATVVALCGSIFLLEGATTAFYVSLVYAAITLRDAVGIRLQAGKQAAVLNRIADRDGLHLPHLKELVGHTPLQVAFGVLVGVFVSVVVALW